MNTDPLRETLQLHAGDAPSAAGLLQKVRLRSRRRRRNRRLGVAGAVVVAVALTLAGPAAWVRAGVDGPETPATQPPRPEPTGATTLAPAEELALPDFPFTPGWAPPGLTDAYYAYWSHGVIELDHYDPDNDHISLSITVEPTDIRDTLDKLVVQSDDSDEDEGGTEPPLPLSEQAVTVRGRDAVLLSNDDSGVVGWQHGPEQWVLVMGGSAEDVLQYAEALIEEPFPARTPFTFDLLPSGATPYSIAASGVRFSPASGSGAAEVDLLRAVPGMEVGCPLSGANDADSGACQLRREPIQVGGHEAELFGNEMVVVYLGGGLALRVAAVGALELREADLIRFAGGVHIDPTARPAG